MVERYHNFIDGKWVTADSYLLNISPADVSDQIGLYAIATSEDVNTAVSAARAAQPIWAQTGLEHKQKVLNKIGDELIARSGELGELIAREEGKTLAEGKGEAARAGQFFHYYAAECLRQIGDLADSVRAGVDIEVRREPVGVVGVITPWNFPIAVAAWKIAPALAYGNAVVLKPSEVTPAAAWALTEIVSQSGLTDGVMNLVIGDGSTTGQALVDHQDLDAVTFTGSVPVGRQVAASATANMAKVQLEMGSKNALLVCADADLDLAVEAAISGAYFGTGQKCTASSRLIVEEQIYDEFATRMVAAIESLKVGDPLDPESQIGSMASEQQFNKVMEYLEFAQTENIELLAGGQVKESSKQGYYIEPTLYGNTDNQMRLNREEIFGPVACLIKAKDFEHGLELVNDTHFGLTAGIMTNSLDRATQFKKQAQAGCVMVNLPTAGTDYHVPFGGRGASSYGSREQGEYAKEFYTHVKTVYLKS